MMMVMNMVMMHGNMVLYHYKTTQYLSLGLVRFSFDDGLWVARVALILKMMLKTIRGQLLPVKM
jgi:hypothetical protein